MKDGDIICCIKDRTYRELPDGKNKRHLYYKKGNFYKILSISEMYNCLIMSCETKNNNRNYIVWDFKDFDHYFANGKKLRKLKLNKINEKR